MSEGSGKPPLWKYVTVKDKIVGGGNVKFICNYCGITITGSYSRLRGHLLKIPNTGAAKCSKVSSSDLLNMKRECDEYDLMQKNAKAQQVSLPQPSRTKTSSLASTPSTMRQSAFDPIFSKRKKVSGDSPLEKTFNLEAR